MSSNLDRIGYDRRLQTHWLNRIIALLIDSVLLGVIVGIVAAFVTLPALFGVPLILVGAPLIFGTLSIFYFVLMESVYGATVGKRIMGLRVVTLQGKNPNVERAFIRNVSKIYWALLLIDLLIGLGTQGDPNQKFSDRIAGTTVISERIVIQIPEPKPTAGFESRFCPMCGLQLPRDALYCTRCGAKQ
jgi:uncharacterized RDD family membrane protein YckC